MTEKNQTQSYTYNLDYSLTRNQQILEETKK